MSHSGNEAMKAVYTQAQVDAACAESAQAERTRISTIMNSDAAKDWPVLAGRLAMTTDMSAEDAMAFMADLPAEAKASTYKTIAERAAELPECGGAGIGAEEAYREAREKEKMQQSNFGLALAAINARRAAGE